MDRTYRDQDFQGGTQGGNPADSPYQAGTYGNRASASRPGEYYQNRYAEGGTAYQGQASASGRPYRSTASSRAYREAPYGGQSQQARSYDGASQPGRDRQAYPEGDGDSYQSVRSYGGGASRQAQAEDVPQQPQPDGDAYRENYRGASRAGGKWQAMSSRNARSRMRERARKQERSAWILRFTVAFIAVDVILLLAIGIRAFLKSRGGGEGGGATAETGEAFPEESQEEEAEETGVDLPAMVAMADRLSAQYDYDGAIALLQNSGFSEDPEIAERIQSYENTKNACVPADMKEITHVFFHILIVDTERALTNDTQGKDFNQVMTTIEEFNAILEQMYQRGYVLVGLHDMAEIQVGSDGVERMVVKQILLPEGKKPFVMSEDDVCYYEYMEGRGFADKMVLDEDGKLKLQYTDRDGNVSIGDYDIVPLLDNFIEAHPDFSYHGHKAIIAFTGYNGVLGYRTDETYDPSSENYDPGNTPNENIEADRETVRQLTKALVEDGYEIASHSWGHANFSEWSFERLQRDTDRWERNVETLLPAPCDIILYPFGADIGDWHPYTADNAKFNLLQGAGFRYYCNVDSNQYWIQYGDNFMRQGRRNLDGYRLYEAFSGRNNRVEDLMDVATVFDQRRPVPIGWEY